MRLPQKTSDFDHRLYALKTPVRTRNGPDHGRINELSFGACTVRLLTKVSLSPKKSYQGVRTQDIEMHCKALNPWLVSVLLRSLANLCEIS